MTQYIDKYLDESLRVAKLQLELKPTFLEIANQVLERVLQDGTVFFCGNGGSAADSQHLAAELVGRFKKNRKPIRSISLTTDTSIITSTGNDFSFDEIFSRQLTAIGRKGDVLIAISTIFVQQEPSLFIGVGTDTNIASASIKSFNVVPFGTHNSVFKS